MNKHFMLATCACTVYSRNNWILRFYFVKHYNIFGSLLTIECLLLVLQTTDCVNSRCVLNTQCITIPLSYCHGKVMWQTWEFTCTCACILADQRTLLGFVNFNHWRSVSKLTVNISLKAVFTWYLGDFHTSSLCGSVLVYMVLQQNVIMEWVIPVLACERRVAYFRLSLVPHDSRKYVCICRLCQCPFTPVHCTEA